MSKIKAIFFDLDGTLAPLDEPRFRDLYMDLIGKKAMSHGHDYKTFISCVGKGVYNMFTNDGKQTNEEVFWKPVYDCFPTFNKDVFEDFYKHDFKQTLCCIGENKYAREIVEYCKERFDLIVLSTNPLFPKVATLMRMNEVGLKEDDFDYITAFEDSYYCKPNPMYFISLLKKFNLKPEEVIVLGNNDYEDCQCAFLAGIKNAYLIGDGLIFDKHCTMKFDHIKMEDVVSFLKTV